LGALHEAGEIGTKVASVNGGERGLVLEIGVRTRPGGARLPAEAQEA
jgi:hypothetical protein